jgi:hypothetical protein
MGLAARAPPVSVTILICAVTAGFQAYRPALCGDLQRYDVDVKVERGFKPYGPIGLGEAEVATRIEELKSAAGLARG